MDLSEITKYLENRLKTKTINPKHVLSLFKLNNEDYRLSYEYTDPINYPFFYYLGKKIMPTNLLEMGFDTGIESGCFINGCKNLSGYFGFRLTTDTYWSSKIACSNISNIIRRKIDYWNGNLDDPEFIKKFISKKWDCALMLDQNLINKDCLNMVWNQMPINGILVINNINSEQINKTFQEFCTIKNKLGAVLKTRYGTGIIIK